MKCNLVKTREKREGKKKVKENWEKKKEMGKHSAIQLGVNILRDTVVYVFEETTFIEIGTKTGMTYRIKNDESKMSAVICRQWACI